MVRNDSGLDQEGDSDSGEKEVNWILWFRKREMKRMTPGLWFISLNGRM